MQCWKFQHLKLKNPTKCDMITSIAMARGDEKWNYLKD